ncbi:MAG TPA: PAS domain-containing protein [Flavisolibacter sp.]|jgi:PAS domain S-box-containing protein
MKALSNIEKHLNGSPLAHSGKPPAFSSLLKKITAFITGKRQVSDISIANTRNFFYHVFNSVSDMVLILDKNGTIVSANRSALEHLKYEAESLKGKSIDILVRASEPFLPKLNQLENTGKPVSVGTIFFDSSKAAVPVLLTATSLTDHLERKTGIVLTGKDLRFQLRSEALVAQTIIDTREKEQLRLAQDLHDSVGQSLSATKFFISATTGEGVTSEEQKEGVMQSNRALTEAIAEMRDICFNLMPVAIGELALVQAVREACSKFRGLQSPEFEIREISVTPALSKEMEIDLYRIIQEFITNTLKHSQASKVRIIFYEKANVLRIILRDNGKGFDAESVTDGMGLKNIQSRINSHNGTLQVKSTSERGVAYFINIPIKASHES